MSDQQCALDRDDRSGRFPIQCSTANFILLRRVPFTGSRPAEFTTLFHYPKIQAGAPRSRFSCRGDMPLSANEIPSAALRQMNFAPGRAVSAIVNRFIVIKINCA